MTNMADLHVEGAFGTVGASDLLELGDPTRGKLDTGKLGAGLGGEVFVDITAYGRSFSTRRGATRADGPVLRYEAGTASIVLRNDDRRFDPTNLAGPYVSGDDTGPYTKVGAFLDGPPLGTSSWVDSVTEWEALTGITLSATRRYAGTDYTIGPTLTAMVAAGVRICLSFSPPYSPPSSVDRASIGAMLATLKATGADVRVALHHEPFFGGLTATEYVNMIAFYGPTVRQHYPLWAVFSGDDTDEDNGYYPGDGTVDGIAADCYGISTTNLDNCADMADAHDLPLGLWEFNAANDFGIDPSPVSSATHAQGETFFTYVKDFFVDRLNTGKVNGDILFFSATGATTGTENFLGDAFSQAGGFEGGIGHWVAGANTTVAASSAQAHSGDSSLLLTCTTAGTISAAHCLTANILTQGVPVSAGDTVAFSCWFRPVTTARFCQTGVLFYDSAGVFLSTTFTTSLIETAGAWKFNSGTATAPANAAFAKFNPQVTSVAVGEQHYLDDPQIGVLPATTDHTAAIQYPWDYRIEPLAAIEAALNDTGFGETLVTPMRSVRIRATWDGTIYELWRGYADSWDIGYPDPRYSEATLSATDAFKVFQAYNRIAVAAAGASELSGARVDRVLDSVSWPSTDRDIAAGDTTLQATTLEGVALDELQLVGESELGELYVDGGGRVVFRNRQAILTDTRSNTSQATFGPGNLPYQDVTLAYDDTTLVNLAQVTREGGTTQTATDSTSVGTYLTHTSTQDGLLMEADTEAQSYAQFIVYIGKDPELRFTQLVVKPQRDPANLWPQVLGREIGDRITVELDPPGGGATISRDVFIRGIEHAVSPGSWTTTWTLQSATKYAFFVLNNATLGKLDANALGY